MANNWLTITAVVFRSDWLGWCWMCSSFDSAISAGDVRVWQQLTVSSGTTNQKQTKKMKGSCRCRIPTRPIVPSHSYIKSMLSIPLNGWQIQWNLAAIIAGVNSQMHRPNETFDCNWTLTETTLNQDKIKRNTQINPNPAISIINQWKEPIQWT